MVTKKADVQNLVDKINHKNTTEEDREKATIELQKHANSGVKWKYIFRRFFFGFNLAEAIERWLRAFDPSKVYKSFHSENGNKEQILPEIETHNVVKAWMRYSLFKAVILLLLSFTVTLFTAYFLYKQLSLQEEIFKRDKLYLYTKALYDEDCSLQAGYIIRGYCPPVENSRIRLESLSAYINLVSTDNDEYINLSNAHLEFIDFPDEFIFNDPANTKKVIFDNAYFMGSNIKGAHIINASFLGANFSDTKIEDIRLTNINLDSANFSGSVIKDVNFTNQLFVGTNFFGANLNKVNFRGSELLRVEFTGSELIAVNLTGVKYNSYETIETLANAKILRGTKIDPVVQNSIDKYLQLKNERND